MIITKILGGLGNQLFQYAAGRALAAQHNTELKLDLTGFADYKLRKIELDKFNLPYGIATQEEIALLKATTSLHRVKARLTPTRRKRFYKQPFFHFDPAFFSLHSPVYLQGYFQSEKYFAPIAKELRQDLTFQNHFSTEVMGLAEKMKSQASVSVHIRRGDYNDAESLRVHGVLPLSYYQQAVELIRQRVESVRFYLFSDDPETAAKTLNLPEAQIISGRITNHHHEDFYLMQHCQHNIIANSSFSWWAAWLNPNPAKMVIAPQKWFAAGPQDTQDLLPQSWTRL